MSKNNLQFAALLASALAVIVTLVALFAPVFIRLLTVLSSIGG